MNTANTFYGWSTSNDGGHFVAVVTKNTSRTQAGVDGRYCDTEVVNVAKFTTRARAVGYAKKMVRYYKQK